jgi:hypothetical protein
MEPSHGQMRAAHLQENVRAIERLGADVFARVKARAPSVVTDIQGALRPTWLEARLDVALTEALYQELGADAVRRVNRDAIVASVNGPLLKPMKDGLVSVLGLTPATALKWLPRGWQYIYREFGDVTWDPSARELRIEKLPRFALDSVGWCEGCAGAVLGVMEASNGADVRADVDRRIGDGAATGTLVIRAAWHS